MHAAADDCCSFVYRDLPAIPGWILTQTSQGVVGGDANICHMFCSSLVTLPYHLSRPQLETVEQGKTAVSF